MANILIKSENGEEFNAYVAYPDTDEPSATIIVIQEIFGVNKNMQSICDQIANEGYVAICPDLFWRIEAGIELDDRNEDDVNKAFELYKQFDENIGVQDLIATLEFIKKQKFLNGKTGCLGFCLGGKLAYLMAARSDVDCAVSYYGVGIEAAIDEVANITKPCLLHIAEKDQFVPKEAQEIISTKTTKINHIETYIYEDVDHAFARINGDHYNQNAAHEANMKTAYFLAKNLA